MNDRYKEIIGCLFSCPSSSSMAHCVSEDMKMSKGIAIDFRNKFNNIQELLGQSKKIGEVAVLKDGNRFIYYLVTKSKYFEKPSYKNFTKSLINLKKHMFENKVKEISIPKIGCGLDGLYWDKVKKIINKILLNSTKDWLDSVTVYILP